MAAKKVVKKTASKKVLVRPARYADKPEIDLVSCEMELRKYVKRDGGFRKDLSNDDKARANQLLKLLKRKKLEWDLELAPETDAAKRPLI